MSRFQEVQGVQIPTMIYGTAWKEAKTQEWVGLALDAGFRGIDTANQRRHYFEAAVGAAVRERLASGAIARKDLFLQTKFTYLNGQDHRLPYDPGAPVSTQVQQSFESSLEHLGVESLEAYLLHGPSSYPGLAPADWEAWHAMEALQKAGRTRLIGVSNVVAQQLEELWDGATVKPAVVQNRTFTRPGSDAAVRSFCHDHGIAYEGFSLLTGNRLMMTHHEVHRLATAKEKTVAQVVFRYCLQAGMVVLTGTTSAAHMADDLDAHDFTLSPSEMEALSRLGLTRL